MYITSFFFNLFNTRYPIFFLMKPRPIWFRSMYSKEFWFHWKATHPQPLTISAIDLVVVITEHALSVDPCAMSAAKRGLGLVLYEAFLHMFDSWARVYLVAARDAVHWGLVVCFLEKGRCYQKNFSMKDNTIYRITNLSSNKHRTVLLFKRLEYKTLSKAQFLQVMNLKI